LVSTYQPPRLSLIRRGGIRELPRRPDQDLEQIADRALLHKGVGQWKIGHDRVAISATLSLAQHVTALDQVAEDPVGGPLGDPYCQRDVAQANAGGRERRR
jgi:hypothetical protein